MTWTRVVVVVVLAQVSVLVAALDKQIKLEDIERDNLQTELLKQQRGHAYQQQQQQQQQQQAEPIDQGFTYQTHHPRTQHQPHQHQQAQHQQPQHHYRFEQQLQVQPERPQLSPHQQHHQQLLYQAVPQAVMPTHIMYLIMPNGNVAAFQLAPHPNHIQAYYSPGKQQFGTLFHQQQQAVHQAMQQTAVPMLQYYQPQAPQSHVPQVPQFVQRFQQPSVHHQPSLSFNSPQAHQLHAQHFSSLGPSQHDLLFRELSAEAPAAPEAPVINPDISSYSAHPAQPSVQQSPKSLFGTGVKVTASPQLKGSFSTQTGQSYTNFRQYG